MVDWDADPDELVAALVEYRWLDEHPKHRLVVHGWLDHCIKYIKGNLVRWNKIPPNADSIDDGPEDIPKDECLAEDPPSQVTSSADAEEAPRNESDTDEFVTIAAPRIEDRRRAR